jgi:hypothetical protein
MCAVMAALMRRAARNRRMQRKRHRQREHQSYPAQPSHRVNSNHPPAAMISKKEQRPRRIASQALLDGTDVTL